MTCREFIEFLLDYREDRLAPDERRRFDEHLAECPHCEEYLESYRRTIDLTAAAFDDPVGADVPQELIDAVLRSRRR